jgi:hypothetical protein
MGPHGLLQGLLYLLLIMKMPVLGDHSCNMSSDLGSDLIAYPEQPKNQHELVMEMIAVKYG